MREASLQHQHEEHQQSKLSHTRSSRSTQAHARFHTPYDFAASARQVPSSSSPSQTWSPSPRSKSRQFSIPMDIESRNAIPSSSPSKRSYSMSTNGLNDATSIRPFLQAGWRELKDIFDLDNENVLDIEDQSPGSQEDLDMSAATLEDKPTMSTNASEKRSTHTTILPPFGSQSDRRSESLAVTRCGLALSCLVWSAASIWALQQDYDLFSPTLILPLFLPLPLSLSALWILRPSVTTLKDSSRSNLLFISRALRAHLLLQGILAFGIWAALSDTATYHSRHQSGKDHAKVGSLSQRLMFTVIAVAQAGLPVLIGLSSQWALASRVARLGQCHRDDDDVQEKNVDGGSQGTTSNIESLLPTATLSRRGSAKKDDGQVYSAPSSPSYQPVEVPCSPRAGNVEAPSLKTGSLPRTRRSIRSTHRSRRPSTAVQSERPDDQTQDSIQARDYVSPLRSSPTPVEEGSSFPISSSLGTGHKRSYSQPSLPPTQYHFPCRNQNTRDRMWNKGVQEGIVQPRRAGTSD
ncbi:unnamed protein product [Sympodiomycopsis kandeliae]